MEDKEKICVLYLDDEKNNLMSFSANFRKKYNLLTASNITDALNIIRENTLHIIITDQRMPELSGVKFLVKAKEIDPKPLRMLLTAYADADVLHEAINTANIFKSLRKPFDEEQIIFAIEEAYKIYCLKREGKEIIEELIKANDLISEQMKDKQLLAKLILATYYTQN